MVVTPNRFLHRLLCLLAANVALSSIAVAQSAAPLRTGHAVPGFYGFETAERPESGMTYQNIVYIYTAPTEYDRHGNFTGASGSVEHLSDHFKAAWTSPWKIFGGQYVAHGVLSLVNSAPNARSVTSEISGLDFGDAYLEPLGLYWVGDKGYLSFGTGYWLDNGNASSDSDDGSGKGFTTFQLSLALTYYPYVERDWHSSFMVRWEQHSKVSGVDLRPGDDVVLDWSIGKHVNEHWNLGVVGYGVWQTSRDRGADANLDIGFYGVAGLGLGARYDLPGWGGHADLRFYQELQAYNHTEGQAVVFSLDFKL
ncbi:MAG: hypothetical protein ACI8X5_002548 [Planctomycetota bacterium]|jgi:hypothetical protein